MTAPYASAHFQEELSALLFRLVSVRRLRKQTRQFHPRERAA